MEDREGYCIVAAALPPTFKDTHQGGCQSPHLEMTCYRRTTNSLHLVWQGCMSLQRAK